MNRREAWIDRKRGCSIPWKTALAWEAALGFLRARPRSCGEMKDFLRRKGFGQTASEATLQRLEDSGYLDDARFVEAWLHHRSHAQPRGGLWVRRELREKKVPADLVEELAAPYLAAHEEETAWDLAQKRWPRLLSSPRGKERLARYLFGRGFSPSTIHRVLERLEI
jgi:regulatory protein